MDDPIQVTVTYKNDVIHALAGDHMSHLKEVAAANGLSVIDEVPDGNCLFSAIARQLPEQRTTRDVRLEIAEYIRCLNDNHLAVSKSK